MHGFAQFVVRSTPDGSLDGRGTRSARTGQALRIAREHGVPVLSLARAEHAERVRTMLTDRD